MSERNRREDRILAVDRQRHEVSERERSVWRSIYGHGWIRKTFVLLVLAIVWELYARHIDNALQFPTFLDTLAALRDSLLSGEIPTAALYTIPILLTGYVAGLALAGLLTAFASATRIGADLLETLTACSIPCPRSPCCRSRCSGSASARAP